MPRLPVDPARVRDGRVFTTPFTFTFRPIRRTENVLAYSTRWNDAARKAWWKFAKAHGLERGDRMPYTDDGYPRRGAKWTAEPATKGLKL